jgi:hypothetical protein
VGVRGDPSDGVSVEQVTTTNDERRARRLPCIVLLRSESARRPAINPSPTVGICDTPPSAVLRAHERAHELQRSKKRSELCFRFKKKTSRQGDSNSRGRSQGQTTARSKSSPMSTRRCRREKKIKNLQKMTDLCSLCASDASLGPP